jgi:uncharacterized membrane protein (DUF4010 family)
MARNAILIAIATNTILKFVIALWAGSKELKKSIYLGYGLILLSALVALVVVNML